MKTPGITIVKSIAVDDEIKLRSDSAEYEGLCVEAKECYLFCDCGVKYSEKLLRYKRWSNYYSDKEFLCLTDGLGKSRSFRSYLCDCINNADFKSNRIKMTREYVYTLADTDAPESFGESFFEFLCFLELNRFWRGAIELKTNEYSGLPVLIKDFEVAPGRLFSQCNEFIKNNLKPNEKYIVFTQEETYASKC